MMKKNIKNDLLGKFRFIKWQEDRLSVSWYLEEEFGKAHIKTHEK